MAKDRQARKNINESDYDFLKPIDILSLGSDDDPCFGKHHDLLAPECKECGDSDFCALVKAQKLHQERVNIESKKRFKDIEEADYEMIKKREHAIEIIKQYRNKGYKRLKTILIVARELNIHKNIIKQIYDQN